MRDYPIPSLPQILASIAVIVGFSVFAGSIIGDDTGPSPAPEAIIESPTLIAPEIKLVVNNNVVDTIYVYRKVSRP